jgi:hypothetical protein
VRMNRRGFVAEMILRLSEMFLTACNCQSKSLVLLLRQAYLLYSASLGLNRRFSKVVIFSNKLVSSIDVCQACPLQKQGLCIERRLQSVKTFFNWRLSIDVCQACLCLSSRNSYCRSAPFPRRVCPASIRRSCSWYSTACGWSELGRSSGGNNVPRTEACKAVNSHKELTAEAYPRLACRGTAGSQRGRQDGRPSP